MGIRSSREAVSCYAEKTTTARQQVSTEPKQGEAARAVGWDSRPGLLSMTKCCGKRCEPRGSVTTTSLLFKKAATRPLK